MSSGEQANQQPPALENFLIVAYRSLRGNKRVSAFGCPKDLLDASADKIEEMTKEACFVKEEFNPETKLTTFQLSTHHHNPSESAFLLFEKSKRASRFGVGQYQVSFRGVNLPIGYLAENRVLSSFYVHKGGFSGLTVIIHDCYVVIIEGNQPRVLRYYKDEEGQIKCETTAIPVKPQNSYYNGWVSYNRSFVHHFKNVAVASREGALSVFRIDDPSSVKDWIPLPSKRNDQPATYLDVKLYDPSCFGLFAVTACGRIDYYQGAKRLVHSHTIDLAELGLELQANSITFTTIGCDPDYLAVGIVCPEQNVQNRIAIFKIRKYQGRITGLKLAGSTEYSVAQASIKNKNPAHHLAFMYPKRYRILYAQQLFTLGSLFYVDRLRNSLVWLWTNSIFVCSLWS